MAASLVSILLLGTLVSGPVGAGKSTDTLPPSSCTEAASEPSLPAGTPESDSDRGCCLWKTKPAKCTYTNRKYCSTKAAQNGVSYRFFKDQKCEDVPACR